MKDDLNAQEGIDMAKKCLRVARDGGVNLFDNAEVYGVPYGEAERIMGEALSQLREEDPEKWRRSDIIVTTKVFINVYEVYICSSRYGFLVCRGRFSGAGLE